jgi:hypothetical protein
VVLKFRGRREGGAGGLGMKEIPMDIRSLGYGLLVCKPIHMELFSSHPMFLFYSPFFHFCLCIKTLERVSEVFLVEIWKIHFEVFFQDKKFGKRINLICTRSTLIFQPETNKHCTKTGTQNTLHKDRKIKYSALRHEIKTYNVTL